jgi:hypothetical protein
MNMPPEWIAEPVEHDGQKRITLRFSKRPDWDTLVRTLVGSNVGWFALEFAFKSLAYCRY